MSISSALSSALSGLNASSRAAELVSSNIANASTPGYGKRQLVLTAKVVGGSGQGVSIAAVARRTNPVVLNDRRIADAGAADRDVRQSFLARLETTLGTSDTPGSLVNRITTLDQTLIEASSRPDSQARLTSVLDAAKGLAGQIAATASDIQTQRNIADKTIQSQVEQVNTALGQITELNIRIRAESSAGRDPSALIDNRQHLIDTIAPIIPLREVDRGNGTIALFTTGGTVLLDGKAGRLEFTPAGFVTADMTLATGGLSGLALNGRPIDTAGAGVQIGGGSLAAQFAVRDSLAPRAQADLDALARDLVERFSDPALDVTRAPGDPGLFTDAGAAFLPADEVGLAQRLQLNAAVDPARGGALWRLRDGLGAATQGASGNATLLNALESTLTAQRVSLSASFSTGPRSVSSLAADLISGVAGARLSADAEVSYASATVTALRGLELADGVDTDEELQNLLQIEQAYSANARVIQTVGSMIQTLLEL